MNALKARLDAFKQSRFGQFLEKVQNDQVTDLAALLAWGTLSAVLPLILGILSITGLVLRDPQRLDEVYRALVALLPGQASDLLGPALDGVRKQSAAPAGLIALALLLFNGSRFFNNLATIFNHAYHVPNRGMLKSHLLAIAMLLIVTTLLVVSSVALGLGAALGNLPIGLPIGPALGRVISWSLSILTAIGAFLLMYKVLPNKKQRVREALPGALLVTALFFLLSLIFPLYLRIFPPNQAYAVFGVFLAFTFWLYLLGLSFVLGAELNAFLEEPARSVALAEATSRARQGQADMAVEGGQVKAEATGDAPRTGPLGPLSTAQAQAGTHSASQQASAASQVDASATHADGNKQPQDEAPAQEVAPNAGPIKKFLWTGLVSGSLAVGALLARRTSSTVWQTIMREPPPSGKV
jgi:membrane protein